MKQGEIKSKLEGAFGPDVILSASEFRDEISVTVDPGRILDIGRYLRDTPELAMDFLSFVGAVDKYPDTPRFEIVYQLSSTRYHHRFRIKALIDETPEGPASIDSVVSLWVTADWHERETAEMFGVVFRNHPDPRKLLLPEDWTVFPLRKDFPVSGTEETPDLPARA